MRQLILFFLVSFFYSCNAQTANSQLDVDSNSLRIQASKMSAMFIQEDIDAYMNFMYPKIIQLMGGGEKTRNYFIESWKKRDSSLKVIKDNIGSFSKIIYADNTFQCTMPITFEFESSKGSITVKSTLVAISTNGSKWYFIDSYGKTIETLKYILPELSDSLVIPPIEKPVLKKTIN